MVHIDVYPESFRTGQALSKRTKALDPFLRKFAATLATESRLSTVRLYGTLSVGWYSVETEEAALEIKAVTRATLDLLAGLGVEVVFAGGRAEFRL